MSSKSDTEPAPHPAPSVPRDPEAVVDKVRERYGKIAAGEISGCAPAPAATASAAAKQGAAPAARDADGGCCGSAAEAATALQIGYGRSDLEVLPEGANLGLGCGAPVPLLDLRPGEAVLDLGSGAGVDVFLAARLVGPAGRVIGIDMTPEMLARARANATQGGYANVEFREGRLESLPVDDASIDALTSNCVINLVPDKGRVFREIARVLRPGGRLVISDIVLDGALPEAVANDLLAYVGCVSGALDRRVYFGLIEAAGLRDVRLFKDLDYLAAAGYTFSDELRAALRRADVRDADLAGRVRSITFGARKG
jgi:SAM-dependent methyltransferase